MANPLGHFEFMTDDPGKTRAFYGKVFGWEFDDQSMPGYTLIRTGSKPGGGMMKRPTECPHPCLNVYFEVANIEETLKKAQAAGGKTIVPKTAIPGAGHFAMLSDTDGIVVGLYQGQ